MAMVKKETNRLLAHSLMKAGNPHGTHFCIPAFSSVPEGFYTSSNTITGFYYGHLVVR